MSEFGGVANERTYEDVPAELRAKYVTLALAEVGISVIDMSTLIQQGVRKDNEAKVGAIANRLRDAALMVEGKRATRFV